MAGESSSQTSTTTATTAAQREALTAYLEPLCQKHEKGDPITYEDLMASKQAADNVCKEESVTVRRSIE